jgi:hypothetical protein
LIGSRIAPQIQREVEPDLVTLGEVLKCHGRELGDWYRNESAIERANASGTQTDVFHRPNPVSKPADVTDGNRPVADDSNANKEILDGLMSIESDL